MGYPNPLPNNTRLIPSRQLVPGSQINDMNDALYSFQQLTALGVAQVDAAKVDAANVEILAGSAAATGVLLPPANPGAVISILNNSANTENVYPNGTEQIQNAATTYAAAGVAVTMATLTSNVFRCIKKGYWQRTATA